MKNNALMIKKRTEKEALNSSNIKKIWPQSGHHHISPLIKKVTFIPLSVNEKKSGGQPQEGGKNLFWPTFAVMRRLAGVKYPEGDTCQMWVEERRLP